MPTTAWAVYVGGWDAPPAPPVLPDPVAYLQDVTDTVALVDGYTTSLNEGGVSTSLTLDDDATLTDTVAFDRALTLSDTLFLDDATALAADRAAVVEDTLPLADDVTAERALVLETTDSAGLADLALAEAVAPTIAPITTLYSRNRIFAKTGGSPPVARYREAGRKKLVIRNVDPGGRSIEVAYTTQHNGQGTVPTTGWVTIAPGQEFVDTATTGLKIYVRSFGSGSALVDVYTEVTL